MAVNGHYMAWRVRSSALQHVQAYGECVLRDVMPTFTGLEKRADEVADAEFERYGSMPVGEDWNGDMGDFAERAHDKGLLFYETMTGIRQSLLNLFAVGLFHLLEQELADLCRDGSFTVDPPADTKMGEVVKWYDEHFLLELRKLDSWLPIEQLRLIANTVKHSEGPSAAKLRGLRPELFCHPAVRAIDPTTPPRPWPVEIPLAGDGLYVTEEILQGYCASANQFVSDILKYFEEHSDDYYPRQPARSAP